MDWRFISTGMDGPWGYDIQADQEPEYRCCPLCFRAYSDYENTAVVPCWQCRDEVPLARFGTLHVEEWGDMPDLIGGANSPLVDVYSEDLECRFDDLKERWLAEEVKNCMASIARIEKKIAIAEHALTLAWLPGSDSERVIRGILRSRIKDSQSHLNTAREAMRDAMRRVTAHGASIDVLHRRDMRWYREEGYE